MDQENIGGESQNQVQAAPVETAPAPAYPAAVEKMVPQSKVDEIIKAAKYEHKRELEELRAAQHAPSRNAVEAAGTSGLSKEDVAQIFKSELAGLAKQAEQEASEQKVADLVKNFHSKMDSGKERYPDFEEITKKANFGALPYLVTTVTAEIDNAADVMYELIKNKPEQLPQLESLISTQPHLAREKLRQLSESIKVNDRGSHAKQPREPLGQLTQSNVGIDNGQDPSVGDLRKLAPWRK